MYVLALSDYKQHAAAAGYKPAPQLGRQIAVYSVNKYVKFGRRSVFIVYLYEFSHILFKKEE